MFKRGDKMKVSDKQILFMYQVLTDSICILDVDSPFKFDRETRKKYAFEIFNQQSNKIDEIPKTYQENYLVWLAKQQSSIQQMPCSKCGIQHAGYECTQLPNCFKCGQFHSDGYNCQSPIT